MIAIVGGGISGLAAAYELAAHGVPLTVFEASSRLGGLICTERVDGYLIEGGADSMLAQKRSGLALCTELGLASDLIAAKLRAPRTCFTAGASSHSPPLRFSDSDHPAGLLRFGCSRRWAARVSRWSRSVRGREPGRVDRGLLPPPVWTQAAERLAQPLLGGIHAGDIDTLSLRKLAPRRRRSKGAAACCRGCGDPRWWTRRAPFVPWRRV